MVMALVRRAALRGGMAVAERMAVAALQVQAEKVWGGLENWRMEIREPMIACLTIIWEDPEEAPRPQP